MIDRDYSPSEIKMSWPYPGFLTHQDRDRLVFLGYCL